MADAAIAEKRPKFRRRKVLIQPWYQLRVAATILLFILGYSLVLGFLMFYPLQQELAVSANPEQQFWIARQVLELHKRFWPAVLVVASLVAVQSIFVTHRVVGPAYQLQRVVEGYAAAKYDRRAHLRRWDRLKELETAVNALGETLLQRQIARRERVERLRTELVTLQAEGSAPGVAPMLQQRLDEIERIMTDLHQGD